MQKYCIVVAFLNIAIGDLHLLKSCIFAYCSKKDYMTKRLFLLDAMALIYRAYYAMIKSPRITTTGIDTSATLGFTNTLFEIIKNEKPTHIAVAFDTGAPTLRHAEFERYKANREETPAGIRTAVPYIQQILRAFGIPVLALDGYEADDIIGTVAKQAESAGFDVYMMTSDKDYGQLVSEHVFMYKPSKFAQKAEVVGIEEICTKYGIERPEQLIDILGLWGDNSDNIPGVPNIGEVKAKKLIAEFGSIENIYANIEQVSNEKMRQTLIDNEEQAIMSKRLATIILDVPISYDWEMMQWGHVDAQALQIIFDELQFTSLKNRIFKELQLNTAAQSSATPDLFSTASEPTPSVTAPIQSPSLYDLPHHYEEATSVDPSLGNTIFFEWIMEKEKIVGFIFADDNQVKYSYIGSSDKSYLPILTTIFSESKTVVTYNSKLTYRFLQLLQLPILAQVFDLQVAHYLIQPEKSHTLNNLTLGYLNYQLIDPKNQPIDSQEEILRQSLQRVEIYRKLYPILHKELNDNNLQSLFVNIEMPLVPVLAKMENNGIYLDCEILRQSADQLDKEVREIESAIYEYAGSTFNIASPKQLGEVLFERLRIIDNAKLTKTKQYQTGEEILSKLVTRHPIVSLVLKWRGLSKLKSTYIDALPLLVNAKTHRIHTTFNQTVTSTGRLSSTNPNLQNIPIRTARGRDIRRAFVAQQPHAYILAADYSQIELRIVAAVSGDEEMIRTFREEEDIHALTAAKVYHVDISEVTSDMRRVAKTVNFGILYGISAFGLADRLMIPQKEARQLIEEYHKQFPKVIEYLNQTVDFAREKGFVETLLNRRRYIKDINSPNAVLRKAAERNAMNAPIQGTAADLIKIAMIALHRILEERKLQSKMLLQVHDELVFEVPDSELAEMTTLVTQTMNSALQMAVPLVTSVNYGKSWFDAH